MKKIILALIGFICFMNQTSAFSINIDKINIKTEEKIIENLDSQYNMEADDFSNTIITDEKIVTLTKELVKISLNTNKIEEKKEKMTKYMYISESNGFDTLNSSLFIDMYLKKITDQEIKATYIKDIKTVKCNGNDAMSFVYLNDALVNNEPKEIILSFWLKENKEGYKLYYPWLTTKDNLEEYFNTLAKKESNNETIGGTFNELSLTDDKVTDDVLNKILEQNKASVVSITGMNDTGSNVYGSGFFIKEGIIATTWSLFKECLTFSNYMYVNDSSENTYNITGIVTLNTDYDIVVLKLDKIVGKSVKFGDSEKLQTDDKLFMINSKENSGFSIKYGSFLSIENGHLKNMFALNESDVGAALFNKEGEIVGFTVNDQLYSDLSFANSTNYLKKLQDILNKQPYDKINTSSLSTCKENFFLNMEEETIYNKVDNETWNKYKSIGNIEKNIALPLVKASYKDNILSLRYQNKTNNLLDSMYLIADTIEELKQEGYTLTYEDKYKKIIQNNTYKIIIKENMNYLILLILKK